jgi:hypothetical protein
MIHVSLLIAGLLILCPAQVVPCLAVKRAVAQYGEAAVESWARAKGVPDKEIERAKRCLNRRSVRCCDYFERLARRPRHLPERRGEFHFEIIHWVQRIGNGCGMNSFCRSTARMPPYRIREVDGQDDEISDMLAELHQLTFFDGATVPEFDWGHWWLAYRKEVPVAFAGVVPSTHVRNAGYICRVGVLKEHCGNMLQLRLMRAMESRVRRNGWNCIVSDTTQNFPSANNFIRAGYRLYQPQYPWAFPDTLYWRKFVGFVIPS